MTSGRQHERSRSRRRALLLLAVYALFVLLPAAHLLVHEHGASPLAPAGPAGGPTSLAAACGDRCANPLHDHHAHAADGFCAVCRVQGSPYDLPALPSSAAVELAPLGRALPAGSELRSAPQSRGPSVRGPPQSFAASTFDTLVA